MLILLFFVIIMIDKYESSDSMEKDNNLSISEIKKIAHVIIDEEVKKYNIKLKVFPVTFVDFYKDYVSKRKYKLSRKFFLMFCLLWVGIVFKMSLILIVMMDF